MNIKDKIIRIIEHEKELSKKTESVDMYDILLFEIKVIDFNNNKMTLDFLKKVRSACSDTLPAKDLCFIEEEIREGLFSAK